MVADAGAETTGAVKTPPDVMEPAVAIQLTVVLKVPVPATVALHWINWLDWMVDGKQATVTLVTVVGLLLEPQPATHKTAPTTNKRPNLRIIGVLFTVAFSHTELAVLDARVTNSKAAELSQPSEYQRRSCLSRSISVRS